MVSKEEIAKLVLFSKMTDAMLDKLIPIIDVLNFDKDEVIFHETQPALRYYMLRAGHIILEQHISNEVTAIIGSIEPGYSFGWSAMLEHGRYTSDAVCAEPSEVFSLQRDKLLKLFDQDPAMGLRIYQRLLVIIKNRLDHRTSQLRMAIENHPDMHHLFGHQKPVAYDEALESKNIEPSSA